MIDLWFLEEKEGVKIFGFDTKDFGIGYLFVAFGLVSIIFAARKWTIN